MCDLNTAPVEEIAALPGVDIRLAYDLALWRPYLSWDEVERVPGLDELAVAALREAGAELGCLSE